MGDYDRDREPIRDTERTTIVHTDGGGRGGGMVIAVVLIIAVLALLYFLFGGNLNRAADEVGVNVNVDTPKVEVPDVKIPDVDINVPENVNIDLSDGDAPANKSR
jgi:hypothetical protein